MSLHDLIGKHAADLKNSHWDYGRFVSSCTVCGREMIKPPGERWRIMNRNDGH
jgi:hypothetical protein